MNAKKARELLEEYLRDELSPEIRRDLERTLESDEELCREQDELRSYFERIKILPRIQASESFLENVHKKMKKPWFPFPVLPLEIVGVAVTVGFLILIVNPFSPKVQNESGAVRDMIEVASRPEASQTEPRGEISEPSSPAVGSHTDTGMPKSLAKSQKYRSTGRTERVEKMKAGDQEQSPTEDEPMASPTETANDEVNQSFGSNKKDKSVMPEEITPGKSNSVLTHDMPSAPATQPEPSKEGSEGTTTTSNQGTRMRVTGNDEISFSSEEAEVRPKKKPVDEANPPDTKKRGDGRKPSPTLTTNSEASHLSENSYESILKSRGSVIPRGTRKSSTPKHPAAQKATAPVVESLAASSRLMTLRLNKKTDLKAFNRLIHKWAKKNTGTYTVETHDSSYTIGHLELPHQNTDLAFKFLDSLGTLTGPRDSHGAEKENRTDIRLKIVAEKQ